MLYEAYQRITLPEGFPLEAFPIAAFDPGASGNFGWAYARLVGNVTDDTWGIYLTAGALDWPEDFGILTNILGNAKTVVYESFYLRPDLAIRQAGSDMPAPRMIEAIKTAIKFMGIEPAVVEQSPSAAKQVVSGPTLNNMLGKPKGLNDHTKSALRHLIYYIVKTSQEALKQ